MNAVRWREDQCQHGAALFSSCRGRVLYISNSEWFSVYWREKGVKMNWKGQTSCSWRDGGVPSWLLVSGEFLGSLFLMTDLTRHYSPPALWRSMKSSTQAKKGCIVSLIHWAVFHRLADLIKSQRNLSSFFKRLNIELKVPFTPALLETIPFLCAARGPAGNWGFMSPDWL